MRKDFPPKITCAQRALLLHAKSFPRSASPRSYLSPLRKNLKTGAFFKTRKFRYLTLSSQKLQRGVRNESPLCAKRSPQVRKDFPPKITCAQRALLLHAKSFPRSASPRSYLSPLRKNLKTGAFFKTRKFRYLTLSMKKTRATSRSLCAQAAARLQHKSNGCSTPREPQGSRGIGPPSVPSCEARYAIRSLPESYNKKAPW